MAKLVLKQSVKAHGPLVLTLFQIQWQLTKHWTTEIISWSKQAASQLTEWLDWHAQPSIQQLPVHDFCCNNNEIWSSIIFFESAKDFFLSYTCYVTYQWWHHPLVVLRKCHPRLLFNENEAVCGACIYVLRSDMDNMCLIISENLSCSYIIINLLLSCVS